MIQKTIIKQKTVNSVENGKTCKAQEIFYNSKGQEIKQINFSSDNKIISTIVKAYDSKGNLQTTEIQEWTSASGSELQKLYYTHTFDNEGRITQTIITKEGDTVVRKELFTYNKDGSYQVKLKEGENTIEIQEYDVAGRRVRVIYVNNSKEMRFTYDSNGHLLQHIEITPGKPARTIEYENEYNDGKQLRSVITMNSKIRYEYNEQNDMIEEIHETLSGEITAVIRYAYIYW